MQKWSAINYIDNVDQKIYKELVLKIRKFANKMRKECDRKVVIHRHFQKVAYI